MNRTTPTARALGVGGAVALAAATLWTVLIVAEVSTSSAPQWQEGSDFGAYLERYYAWQSSILPQQRGALALLCIGLITVVAAAVRPARGAAPLASIGIAAGAAVWGLTSVAEAGGRRAVDLMAASGNQIDPVNSIAFTIDITAAWMHAAASALLGLGMLTLSLTRGTPRRALCLATGITAVVLAILLLTTPEWSRYAGLALGAVLLPLWTAATLLASPQGRGGDEG